MLFVAETGNFVMDADRSNLDQHALAAHGLAATAATLVLARAAELGAGPATRATLAEMYRVTALARRIEHRLEAGQDAFDRGDLDSASLEWAGALVLTGRLAPLDNQAQFGHRRHHQKSGSTG
jgi:hypothetical protein